MFTGFKIYAIGLIAITLLGLSGWIWHQNQMLINLRAENQAQAQTLSQRNQEIEQLKTDAIKNQRIMLELSKAESEARSESDEVIKSIPQAVKQSNPYNASAPSNVIEFLRQ